MLRLPNQLWFYTTTLLLLLCSATVHADAYINPSDVYAQAVQVEKEVELLQQYFDADKPISYKPVTLQLQPRHVWQKCYSILVQINAFRRKHSLPVNTLIALEPVANLDPALVMEQVQRLNTEIIILKSRFSITEQVSAAQFITGKEPIDVYNKLHQIFLRFEQLNGETINPSMVFGESMRFFADVDSILHQLRLEDNTYPPEKQPQLTPSDSLQVSLLIMDEIQRLQRLAAIPRTDFGVFRQPKQTTPTDVFNMVELALAELQPIKAHLGLSNSITPPAAFYSNKKPADVHQLLTWLLRKLQLVQQL